MLIVQFVLFINIINALRADVSLSNELDNKPSVIGAFNCMNHIRKEETIGNRYGKLTVLQFSHVNKDNRMCYLCRCDCGTQEIKSVKQLRNGSQISCIKCAYKRNGDTNSTHGDCRGGKTKEYFIWRGIKERCLNPNNKGYKNYGGRGITMCDRWKDSFSNFLLDMGRKPDGLSIERINNNGNYCPENCKWGTIKEQTNNTRQNKKLTLDGVCMNVCEWAEKLNVDPMTLYMRVHRGWSDERILTQPISRTIRVYGDSKRR